MTKYVLKRLCYMFVSLFIVITITFFLMKLMPGSPFNDTKLNAQQKEILNEKYGLNDPVALQYVNYLKNVVTGDFGNSFQYHNMPVWDLVKPRLINGDGNNSYGYWCCFRFSIRCCCCY